MKITKDMLIGDALQKNPDCAMVMMNAGLHCIGCHVSTSESIEDGCRAHGMKDEDIDNMVEEMNKLVDKKSSE